MANSIRLKFKRSVDPAQIIFDTVREHLEDCGPIIVCGFRVFPSYLDLSTTEFHGDWNDLKGNNDDYHAFLITGVHKTV
eukprot:CAMPEP_0172445564 /NCGR_PEP_ID=MMETSP1065-20121228/5379_1 /TAXON_ID=265537 /ORGANISM="Amphiprora paludosa, Strain CCMP125" /LENGTH=78 /DNA_ID=CAMNT_0013196447 /DNA_START=44 /DNA_END=276 /DNA_ORIENTATION=+